MSEGDADKPADGGPTGGLSEALAVKRNTKLGLGVGIGVAAIAYLVRIFELLGPMGVTRTYPIVGPEAWFLLLAIVFASATALGVVVVLTAIRAVRLSKRV
ncbi:MAG: hypothetical protein J07HN4v3_01865 [Halonotius sp. J07HN4]|jgi:hypothetical protein|nr:MAG: hypothetical protein J07HN4v3_01865 [Halonotius sp. J07HN4]